MDPTDTMLEDLQMRLTFLDDAVAGLDSADVALSRRLDAIEHALETMRTEILSLRSATGHDPGSEPPPPHY